MQRRNIHRVKRTVPARPNTALRFRFLLIIISCIAVVAVGFFFAARQHFATMEFGLKNSQLRDQVENLEAERRRLILSKEVSLSPQEIRQTAAKLGFRELVASPPTSVQDRVETSTVQSAPIAEQVSLKQETGPTKQVASQKEEKRLVKSIIQQSQARPVSPDERPRIAAREIVVAAVATKQASKLR